MDCLIEDCKAFGAFAPTGDNLEISGIDINDWTVAARKTGNSHEGVVKRGEAFMETWRTRDMTVVNIRHAREATKQTAVKQTTLNETADDGSKKEVANRVAQHVARRGTGPFYVGPAWWGGVGR